jgi:hypothetical protein
MVSIQPLHKNSSDYIGDVLDEQNYINFIKHCYKCTPLTPKNKSYPYIPPFLRGARGIKGGTIKLFVANI